MSADRRSGGRRRKEVSDSDLSQIEEAFRLFDSEENGYVGYHELKAALRAFGFEVRKADVVDKMSNRGLKREDEIDRDIFKSILSEEISNRDPKERLKQTFSLFDIDGTGKINMKNLKKICADLGESIEEEELKSMIEEFDADGDGMIDLSDFEKIMRSDSDDD